MQILVTGMHRSGTSAVARLINMMGAYVGEESSLIEANSEFNPRGYWERTDVVALNDKLLAAINCGWAKVAAFDIGKYDETIKSDFAESARSILNEINPYRPWVIKDPRLCLLLPLWRELMETPVVVFCVRSPLDVAKSLRRRDGIGADFGLALWEKYSLLFLQECHDLPLVFIDYEEILQDPVRAAAELHHSLTDAGVCGLEIPPTEEISSFISPKLCHFFGEEEEAWPRLSEVGRELLAIQKSKLLTDKINKIKLSKESQELLSVLDMMIRHEVYFKLKENEKYSILKRSYLMQASNKRIVEFDLCKYENISSIRYDPGDVEIALKLIEIRIKQKNGKIYILDEYLSNADYNREGLLIFDHNDPSIEIELPDEIVSPEKLIIRQEILATGREVSAILRETQVAGMRPQQEADADGPAKPDSVSGGPDSKTANAPPAGVEERNKGAASNTFRDRADYVRGFDRNLKAILFFDSGGGFHENESINLITSRLRREYSFDLTGIGEAKRVRFSPCRFRCVVRLHGAEATCNDGSTSQIAPTEDNAFERRNDNYYFAVDNPYFGFILPDSCLQVGFTVEFIAIHAGADILLLPLLMQRIGMIGASLSDLETQLKQKVTLLSQNTRTIRDLETRLHALKGKLRQRDLEYRKLEDKLKHLTESHLWRAFQLMRRLLNSLPGSSYLTRLLKKAARRARDKKAVRTIRKSGLFDVDYYLKNNPDVAESGLDPIEHFAYQGWRESRWPNPSFDPDEYLAARPDVAEAGVNPLLHFIRFGRYEQGGSAAGAGTETENEFQTTMRISAWQAPYKEELILERQETEIKLVAFYLPQYHPIPENDRWWGKGFTEWFNVTATQPQFPAHYQPKVPGELGFYDLRTEDTRRRQIELARNHGIYGFCFYYYWFDGKRLLDRPLNQFLADTDCDFPFCICWANENWTRRWDGLDHEILIAQHHSPDTESAFIDDVQPFLHDKRYIRVNGRPLLVIYRPDHFPNPRETAKRFRSLCLERGLGDPLLVMVQTNFGNNDPRKYGFDAAIEFPPHNVRVKGVLKNIEGLTPNFTGDIFSYPDLVNWCLARAQPPYKWFRGLMSGWDNTARRKNAAYIFADDSADEYQRWLSGLIKQTREALPPEERFIFINAWNEWAEGAYLEPDSRHGYAFLNATTLALAEPSLSFPRSPAVVAHIFYPELLDRILDSLANLPDNFHLFVSTTEEAFEEVKRSLLEKYPAERITVRAVPNIGRDWAPMLVEFGYELLNYDLALKIHTKKADYDAAYRGWGDYLLGNLAGSKEIVRNVFEQFRDQPDLGVLFPDYMSGIRDRIRWGGNEAHVLRLTERLGIRPIESQHPEFPAGSMFWFRPRALAPLLRLGLDYSDFDAKSNKLTDGTLAHALERMPIYVAEANGFRWRKVRYREESYAEAHLQIKKIIGESGLFDEAFYTEVYEDVAGSGIEPLDHYVRFGATEGRLPSADFNPAAYSFNCPEVKSSKLSELAFYLLHGKQMGHKPDQLVFRTPFPGKRVRAIGIFAHVYYDDMLLDLISYLKNVPFRFDLNVSTTPENEEFVRRKLSLVFPKNEITVRSTENRGRNIGPLIVEFGPKLLECDLACHVHTKKSSYHKGHAEWGSYLLGAVLGNPEKIQEIVRDFDDHTRLGLVYPECYTPLKRYVEEDCWRENWEIALRLSKRLGINITRDECVPFPVGVMMWFRPAALKPLLALNLKWEDFEEGVGGLDGTLAHAVERLFVLVSQKAGYTYKEI